MDGRFFLPPFVVSLLPPYLVGIHCEDEVYRGLDILREAYDEVGGIGLGGDWWFYGGGLVVGKVWRYSFMFLLLALGVGW